MLCIYHIADHDGKGSAAIVKRLYPEAELLGLNHDMEIPFDDIKKTPVNPVFFYIVNPLLQRLNSPATSSISN